MDDSQKKNSSWLTLLSVICCVSVVFTHTNGCYDLMEVTDPKFFGANFIEQFLLFAVPCFFMISGANLIDYRDRYDSKTYFKKRFWKTVFPFAVFTTLALIGEIVAPIVCEKLGLGPEITSQIPKVDLSFWGIFHGYTNSTYLTPFWFFIIIFFIYLFIPLVAHVQKEYRIKICLYISILCFIGGSLFPFVLKVSNCNISDWGYLEWCAHGEYLLGPIMFATLGYVFKNVSKVYLPLEISLYVLGIASLICNIIFVYQLNLDAGKVATTDRDLFYPPCVFNTLAVFILSKRVGPKIMVGGFSKFINFMSNYTYGIYLTHLIFWAAIFVALPYIGLDSTSYIYRLLSPFIIIPCCIGFTFILRKIPGIRRLVPR